MSTLWFDDETYSETDLKLHGTHRYAECPSTEIMIAQWALDEGEPVVEDLTGREYSRPSEQLLDLMHTASVTVVAHNAVFDRTTTRRCWNVEVPIERWYCTMVQALAHGLPGSLDKIGGVLGHEGDEAKDKRGRDLIQLFCKPRPKNMALRRATRNTHPAEWADFLGYSRQDVIAMRAISRDLPNWNYKQGHTELDLWHLDQHVNDRGFLVDLNMAHGAIAAVAVETKRLKAETIEATDGLVSSPSKRDAMLTFILAEYGVDLPDMKADTLRRRIEDPELPDAVKLLLSIRLEATKTSTAKYKALVNATSADGRLRNTLQFAGAQRTARWAGRIFQPQNLVRPNIDLISAHFGMSKLPKKEAKALKQTYEDQGVAALKGGFADVIFDNVMGLTANLVRGAIIAPFGKKLTIADLANIEGRGLAYLAGEEWKLQAFRDFDEGTGADLYILSYARAFGLDPADVEDWMRQIGKVMELGLGYEGGVAAFLTFAAVYNMDLDELADAVHSTASKESLAAAYGMWDWTVKKNRSTLGLAKNVWVACEVLKASWRAAHPATKALWASASESVKAAIASPGLTFDIGDHLKVRRDGAWLRIRLPSGRYLCYLQPKIADDGQISYMGVSQYTRQWCRVKTYGGKLIENCTQAFARDVMAHNMPAIDASGYPIVLTVHDEIITEPDDSDEFSHEALADMMTVNPPWAPGLPLAAAGFETHRYHKG